jgi:hypothetical protein
MIALPPGCTVTYSLYIDVQKLTDEMIEWFNLVGGRVWTDSWYDTRGREQTITYVSYGRGKRCHYYAGSSGVKLHFAGEDASIASIFLLKFLDSVIRHNLNERMEYFALHGE